MYACMKSRFDSFSDSLQTRHLVIIPKCKSKKKKKHFSVLNLVDRAGLSVVVALGFQLLSIFNLLPPKCTYVIITMYNSYTNREGNNFA